MGRHKKVRQAVTMETGNTVTIERPQTFNAKIQVRIVEPEPACPHCGSKGESRNQKVDDRYASTLGFDVVYMKCHSAQCLKNSEWLGRGWKYHRKSK